MPKWEVSSNPRWDGWAKSGPSSILWQIDVLKCEHIPSMQG